MRKDPHIANIFSAEEEDCLSLEQMTAYQQGQLAGQDKHLVERHLLNCELCAITLESIAEHGAAAIAEGAAEVTELAWDRVAQRERRKRRGAFFWIVSAASIALLVTVGYFTLRGPSEIKINEALAEAMEQTLPLETPSTMPDDNLAMSRSAEESNGLDVVPTDRQLESKAVVVQPSKTEPAPYRDQTAAKDKIATGKTMSGKDAVKGGGSSGKEEIKGGAIYGKESAKGAVYAPMPTPTAKPSMVTATPNAKAANDLRKENDDFAGAYAEKSISLSEAQTDANDSKKDQFFALEDDDEALLDGVENRATENLAAKDSRVSNAPSGKVKSAVTKTERRDKAKPTPTMAGTVSSKYQDPSASAPANSNGEMEEKSYDEGIIAYREGNYREAARALRQATELTPSNLEAHIYAADAFLRISQPQAALYHIDRVLAVPGNSHMQDAEWYKALAFLQLKEGNKAKKQLESVVARGGKYKAQAEKALLDLK
jgi:tetratricopeptide (TPR) repeat protein